MLRVAERDVMSWNRKRGLSDSGVGLLKARMKCNVTADCFYTTKTPSGLTQSTQQDLWSMLKNNNHRVYEQRQQHTEIILNCHTIYIYIYIYIYIGLDVSDGRWDILLHACVATRGVCALPPYALAQSVYIYRESLAACRHSGLSP